MSYSCFSWRKDPLFIATSNAWNQLSSRRILVRASSRRSATDARGNLSCQTYKKVNRSSGPMRFNRSHESLSNGSPKGYVSELTYHCRTFLWRIGIYFKLTIVSPMRTSRIKEINKESQKEERKLQYRLEEYNGEWDFRGRKKWWFWEMMDLGESLRENWTTCKQVKDGRK